MLILMGLLGLADLTNSTNLAISFYYVAVGVFFAYLGFLQRGAEVVREVAGGLGVPLVLVMGVAISAPLLGGEEPLLSSVEVACLALGILAARYLPDRAPRLGDFRKVMVRPNRFMRHGPRGLEKKGIQSP